MATLNVHFLPELSTPEELAGGTVVVIDVLRATTTIAYALAAGATEVIPCLDVEEAREVARRYPPGMAVLGGERRGVRIPGFDMANSPLEYTPAAVDGKTVVFTTTNGTRAMQRCRLAAQVWLAAFANLRTIAQRVVNREVIHILCAGTNGQISSEDVLVAGALARRIAASDRRNSKSRRYLDGAQVAMGCAEAKGEIARRRLLRESAGGRNLVALGMMGDVRVAARMDVLRVAPRIDPATWRIVDASQHR